MHLTSQLPIEFRVLLGTTVWCGSTQIRVITGWGVIYSACLALSLSLSLSLSHSRSPKPPLGCVISLKTASMADGDPPSPPLSCAPSATLTLNHVSAGSPDGMEVVK